MVHHDSTVLFSPFVSRFFAACLATSISVMLNPAAANANERRITIQTPTGGTPAPNWAFGLSIRNNPTGGGSTIVSYPAGASSNDVANGVADALKNEMGINATTNGNTLIISQHNQEPGFDFDPLAPGTKVGTSFGGLSGSGPTLGPWGVRRAFRVWAPAPPPVPAQPVQVQRKFTLAVAGEGGGMPGVINGLEVNLLDVHDDVLFSRLVEVPDVASQEELNFALMQAFADYPMGLGGWLIQPDPADFYFGNNQNEWMTGGGIEVLLHPGHEESRMHLELSGEEMLFPWETYADFNVDGIVDGQDAAIVQANFGAVGAAFADGDANFDAWVNGFDLLEVQRQHGRELAGAAAAARAVPEPSGVGIMLWGLVALASGRSRLVGRGS